MLLKKNVTIFILLLFVGTFIKKQQSLFYNNIKCIKYTYMTLLASWVAGLYVFKSHLIHYVLFLAPSRDVLAEAQLEVKLNNIPEGKVSIVKWRGKPVFIYHR